MTHFAKMLEGKSADELVALSHLDRSQLLAALKLLNRCFINALEIGCYKGETTAWLLEHGVDRVDVVDPFSSDAELASSLFLRRDFEQRVLDVRERVTVHPEISAVALPRLAMMCRRFDLIYVDGSHDSRDVLLDAVLSFRMLTMGGIMIFDDFLWEWHEVRERNPGPAIEAFCRIYAPNLECLATGYQVSVRKVKEI